MFDGIYKIARDEGVLSLYKGSLARILFHVPMTAIAMGTVEMAKPKIQKYFDGNSN
jgi:hypothetical protein